MWNFWTNIDVVYNGIIPSLTFVWKLIMSTIFIAKQFTIFFNSNRSHCFLLFFFIWGGVHLHLQIPQCCFFSGYRFIWQRILFAALINTAHAVVTSIIAVELIESDCPQNEPIHASFLWQLWSKMRIHSHSPPTPSPFLIFWNILMF